MLKLHEKKNQDLSRRHLSIARFIRDIVLLYTVFAFQESKTPPPCEDYNELSPELSCEESSCESLLVVYSDLVARMERQAEQKV